MPLHIANIPRYDVLGSGLTVDSKTPAYETLYKLLTLQVMHDHQSKQFVRVCTICTLYPGHSYYTLTNVSVIIATKATAVNVSQVSSALNLLRKKITPDFRCICM